MLLKRKTYFRMIPEILEKFLGVPDPRITKWTLFRSPFIFLTILTIYWSTIYILNDAMKRRKALRLRRQLVVYNFAQVTFSMYIFKEIMLASHQSNYKLTCSVLDKTHNPASDRLVNVFYWFYISKIIDLFDTVFFALRKKKEQMSFLHLYHHSSMIFNWYLGTLYLPGGQSTFSVAVNSFVHIIMYTYYLLSAMGPYVRKYLWWKKYLTQLQMVQFILIMTHLLYGLYNKCPAPQWLLWFTVTYLWTLVLLFGQFYYKTYRYKRNKKYKKMEKTGLDIKAGGDCKKFY